MSQYEARRSFYGGGRHFTAGQAVDLDRSYIARLEQRGLVRPAAAMPAPSETKVIAPAEVKTPQPVEPKVDTSAEAPESPQEAPDDLDALSYKDLKERAKTAGIKGYNTMKAEDIKKQLRERE